MNFSLDGAIGGQLENGGTDRGEGFLLLLLREEVLDLADLTFMQRLLLLSGDCDRDFEEEQIESDLKAKSTTAS